MLQFLTQAFVCTSEIRRGRGNQTRKHAWEFDSLRGCP